MSKSKKKRKRKKPNAYLLSVNMLDSFDKIKKVHRAIPECDFDCDNCNENCCVSPYICIAEFLYVASYILRKFNEPYKILLRDNGKDINGVTICPFLDDDKKCLIYSVRHYKCRMTGMDILDSVFAEVCQHKHVVGIKSPKITKEQWVRWVDVLTRVNKPLKYNEQLQFHEWIKFYFDDDYRLDSAQIRVRDFLRNYLKLNDYIPVMTSEDLIG